MDTVTSLIILRLLHISCGVFWAGAAIYLAAFIGPAVKASGPEGGKFMGQLVRTNKLPMVMTIASTLNIITGVWLLWILSNGFAYEWMVSTHGLILNTGALLAIIAYVEGLIVTRPAAMKMNLISQQMAGNPPTPEQAQKLGLYRKKIFSANNLNAILLAGAVVAMSLAKYF